MTDSTLSEAIKEAYASAPTSEIIYHTLEFNHSAFTTPLRVVRDTNTLDVMLEDSIYSSWRFEGSDESWTATNATLAAGTLALELTATVAGPQLISPTVTAFAGSSYVYVRARVRRISGTDTWDGSLYYANGVHGFSASYYETVSHPAPSAMDEWAVIEWNMTTLTVGGTDWVDSTDIDQIRIDLVTGSADVWEIDWITIGTATVSFTPYAFDIVPPETTHTAIPQCVIEIDNVDRVILTEIDAAIATSEKIEVTYRAYLSHSLLGGPENDPPLTMTIQSISADVFRIRAVAGFQDLANKRFPSQDYTAEVFPGLIPQ